jgi:hypothetical protein
MYKPADVMTSIPIKTEVTITEILAAAGDVARKPDAITPLDFVDKMAIMVR